jgi:hypothetical protein
MCIYILYSVHEFIYANVTQLLPTDGVSTLSWWWGLSTPETYASSSVAPGRVTQAGEVS